MPHWTWALSKKTRRGVFTRNSAGRKRGLARRRGRASRNQSCRSPTPQNKHHKNNGDTTMTTTTTATATVNGAQTRRGEESPRGEILWECGGRGGLPRGSLGAASGQPRVGVCQGAPGHLSAEPHVPVHGLGHGALVKGRARLGRRRQGQPDEPHLRVGRHCNEGRRRVEKAAFC